MCATDYFIARIFTSTTPTTLCSRRCPRSSRAHEAFHSGLAPNKGMRHFPANGRRADQSRGGPLQEGGAATRGLPNESRPRMSGPRPRRTTKEKKERIIAPGLLERTSVWSASDCIARIWGISSSGELQEVDYLITGDHLVSLPLGSAALVRAFGDWSSEKVLSTSRALVAR